jgi:hypothetical protein
MQELFNWLYFLFSVFGPHQSEMFFILPICFPVMP